MRKAWRQQHEHSILGFVALLPQCQEADNRMTRIVDEAENNNNKSSWCTDGTSAMSSGGATTAVSVTLLIYLDYSNLGMSQAEQQAAARQWA